MSNRRNIADFVETFHRNFVNDNVRHDAQLSTDVDNAVAIKDESKRLEAFSDILRDVLEDVDNNHWLVGDSINAFMAACDASNIKMSYQKLANAIERPRFKRAWLHRLAQVAAYWKPKDRIEDWTFDAHFRRMTSGKGRRKAVRPTTADIKEAVENGCGTPREVTRYCSDKRVERFRKKMRRQANRQMKKQPTLKNAVNKIYNEDYQSVLAQLPPRSIHAMVSDPPFGRLHMEWNGVRAATRRQSAEEKTMGYEVANGRPLQAKRTTLAQFDFIDKFADDGVLLLWQDGGRTLDSCIKRYARKRGWAESSEIYLIRIYSNGNIVTPSPSFMDNAVGPCETKVVVFAKRFGPNGERHRPIRMDNDDNRNWIPWVSPSRSAPQEQRRKNNDIEKGYRHTFETPPQTVAALLKKFIPPQSNQLVVEPFACTAPACVASIECGWRFIGCEMDEVNYVRASQRIAEARGELPKGLSPYELLKDDDSAKEAA